MRHFTVFFMCLNPFIVQSTPEPTSSSSTSSLSSASSPSYFQNVTDSSTTSPTHITSPSPISQSQSTWNPSTYPTTTQTQFTRPVVTTSTMAKPLLTPSPSPGSFNQPHGSASAQYIHFGFLLISLMFLVIVGL